MGRRLRKAIAATGVLQLQNLDRKLAADGGEAEGYTDCPAYEQAAVA
jgi:hypothetical protein